MNNTEHRQLKIDVRENFCNHPSIPFACGINTGHPHTHREIGGRKICIMKPKKYMIIYSMSDNNNNNRDEQKLGGEKISDTNLSHQKCLDNESFVITDKNVPRDKFLDNNSPNTTDNIQPQNIQRKKYSQHRTSGAVDIFELDKNVEYQSINLANDTNAPDKNITSGRTREIVDFSEFSKLDTIVEKIDRTSIENDQSDKITNFDFSKSEPTVKKK